MMSSTRPPTAGSFVGPGASASDEPDSLSRQVSDQVNDAINKAMEEKMRKIRESSPLTRLRLDDLRLHGREQDLDLLRGKLRRIDAVRDELILVRGQSGVGKSALVKRGLQDPSEGRGTAFVGGKFDLNHNSFPYSAVSEALSALAERVLAGENADQIKADVREELGDVDMQLIGNSVHGCRNLLSPSSQPLQTSLRPSFVFRKEAVQQLQYALRRLMKVVCANLKAGVVLFLDDLQWADAPSLELLHSLVQDEDVSSLLVVGAYRDNEVSESHPLMIQLREMEQMGNAITTLQLSNLGTRDVQSLIAEALRMEDNEGAVEALANIVHKKTDGNPFFVIMFMNSLYNEGLIEYNFGAMKWLWDDKAVEQRLVTENVATFMVSRLRRLTQAMQNLMKVASCIGASFSRQILSTIVEQSPSGGRRNSKLVFSDEEVDVVTSFDDVVSSIVEQGLWECESEQTYRFSHDQVQAAAYELIPDEGRAGFKGLLGNILMKYLDPDAIDEALFDIVTLRNYEAPCSDEERHDLARLNIKAGFKASENAAFNSAVVFFQAARELLGSAGWETDKELTTRLYNAEAQARFVIRDMAVTESLVEEILSKDVSVKDKFPAFRTKIQVFLSAYKNDEAISTAFMVCKLLGLEPIPTKMSKVKNELSKTNHLLEGLSLDDIVKLPDLVDEKVTMLQTMLDLTLVPALQTNADLGNMVVFRMVRESINWGIDRTSCVAFAWFGAYLCGTIGDLTRGRQMAEIAELLIERPDVRMKQMKAWLNVVVYSTAYHWTSPLQSLISPFLKGYHSGLESGDIGGAVMNLQLRGWFLWYCSRPLDDALHQLNVSRDVFRKLNNGAQKTGVLILLQAALNLQGDSTRPWVLSGEEMIYEEFHKAFAGNTYLLACLALVQLELFVLFQEFVSAKKLLTEAGDLRPIFGGHFHSVRYTFIESLVCFKSAKASCSWLERRKWKKRGNNSMKLLEGWLTNGNANVLHTYHLLKAQCAVVNGDGSGAEENFKSAITAATRGGFLNDKALGHELASIYYFDKGDDYWAKHHMNLAHESYLEWKATAKATHLAKKHHHLITTSK